MRRCFKTITLNLSKSDSFLRMAAWACFLAAPVAAQASLVLLSCQYFLTTLEAQERGNLATINLVSFMRRKDRIWRLTPVKGPSIKAYTQKEIISNAGYYNIIIMWFTLLWSRMSTMTANFPVSSP